MFFSGHRAIFHAKRAGTTNAVGHAGFAVAADANVCMDPASDGAVLFALPQNSKNTKSSPPDPSLKIRRGAFPRLSVQAGGAKWWALRENGHRPAQKGGDGKGYDEKTAEDVAAQICNDFLPLLKALDKFYRD